VVSFLGARVVGGETLQVVTGLHRPASTVLFQIVEVTITAMNRVPRILTDAIALLAFDGNAALGPQNTIRLIGLAYPGVCIGNKSRITSGNTTSIAAAHSRLAELGAAELVAMDLIATKPG
jgi:hypothetical protein